MDKIVKFISFLGKTNKASDYICTASAAAVTSGQFFPPSV